MMRGKNTATHTRCMCKKSPQCTKCLGTGWRKRQNAFASKRPARTRKLGLDPADRERDHGLYRKYGIGVAEFNAMFAEQGLKCACCSTDTPDRRGWFVDHIHEPGEGLTMNRSAKKHGKAKIRGIVCGRCNAATGLVEAVGLDVVLRYLKQGKSIGACPTCRGLE